MELTHGGNAAVLGLVLSEQRGFIFVHVPRTGGNSVQNVLREYSESEITTRPPEQDGVERFGISHPRLKLRKHSPLRDYRRQMDRRTFDAYFKFTIVRNPWERLISLYFSPHRRQERWDRDAFVALVLRIPPIVDYLDARNLWRPVRGWIRRRIDVDHVMRFENLQTDFERVCGVLGIASVPLPHRNRSERGRLREYYDDELIRLVGRRFHRDVEAFGYAFSGS